ncbi:MAG: ATP-binding protein [Alphaproteobacteria bacterium]
MNLKKSSVFVDFAVHLLLSIAGLIGPIILFMEATPPFNLTAITGLAFVIIFYVWLTWYYRSRVQKNKETTQLLRSLLVHLGTYNEIILIAPNKKTLWTTHPNTYPNLNEFMRKFFARVSPTPAASELRHLIDHALAGSVVLESLEGNTSKKPQKLLVRIIPCETTQEIEGIIITITDMTSYLEGYDHLKKDYQRLVQFLDQAPIALVYTDKQDLIIGVNETLCCWLKLPREQIIGSNFRDLIEETDVANVADMHSKNATVRVYINKHQESKTRSYILTRLSLAEDSSLYETQSDYAHAPIPTAIVTIEGKILDWNPAFLSMLEGQTSLEPGQDLSNLLHPAVRSEVQTKLRRTTEVTQMVTPFEIRFNGDLLHTMTYISSVPTKKKSEVPQLMMQFIDISEQKRLEGQFIQSQKMQAVGQLAGGIAHDFNNLLTAMIGYCDLLLQRYMPNDPSYADVMQIQQNASRAANLVRQLLAFSRQQTLQPKVINITDTLSELSVLLRRLIGTGIELKLHHERDLWLVKVDQGQLEQVITNMAVNARDAMCHSGTLIIRTSNVTISHPQRAGNELLAQGDYIMIEVSDTGSGIAPEDIEHIFEPFFSTKEVGSGTGLGLSTAYGIVKQTGGIITVESEVNSQTTFKIYLPRFDGEEVAIGHGKEVLTGDLTGHGTLMFVEDEDAVRMFSARALREKGYQIIEANGGEKALEFLKQGQKIDLLITDVVMPKMDGPTLSKKVTDFLPHVQTIFISGYTEDTFRSSIDKNTRIHFLQKPFTLKELATKVKEVLKERTP